MHKPYMHVECTSTVYVHIRVIDVLFWRNANVRNFALCVVCNMICVPDSWNVIGTERERARCVRDKHCAAHDDRATSCWWPRRIYTVLQIAPLFVISLKPSDPKCCTPKQQQHCRAVMIFEKSYRLLFVPNSKRCNLHKHSHSRRETHIHNCNVVVVALILMVSHCKYPLQLHAMLYT